MASELPATSSAAAARPDGDASNEPLTSSPRSSDSSNIDKADDSLTLLSDAGDQSMLRHPKGKRKRTAAKDKSILEAAYLANPKPDKTARLDIVSRVSLNEKEVQIWFQNRRQNDRRKSRPLSPQEIAALRYGGMHALSSDPTTPFGHASLSQHSSFSSDGRGASSPPHYQQFTSASISAPMPSTTPTSSPEIGPWIPEALAQRQQQESAASESGAPMAAQIPSGPRSFSSSMSSVGYLANRWNMHSSFSTSFSSSEGNGSSPNGGHPRNESAEVIAGQSPSPPRRLPPPNPTVDIDRRTGSSSSNGSDSPLTSLPAIRRSGLSRSHSALPSLGLTLPPISSLTNSLASGSAPPPMPQAPHPPRLLRGRSRDVHAWESVCDSDTRVDDELSAHAEQEASGSAIAAISLLRSTSSVSSSSMTLSSSVLQPNGHKRNVSSRSGIPKPGMKRAKLGRALSSVARMQNVSNTREESGKDKMWVDDEKKKKLKLSTLLSGNDSDKENWSPDEEGRPSLGQLCANSLGSNGRRPLPSSRNGRQQRAVLGGDGSKGSKHAQLATRMTGGKVAEFDAADIYEDASGRSPPKRAQLSRAATLSAPDDVERFMRGAQVSPSKKGDMDCIAGLLSLSQGNWR
ncbi:homeobox transcription factor [Sporothrix brasiliensis 5110]|uniref:Homeobox transcription factor n=1 Tax=Sporothrix brasiliensis 5110 TaxID=1398154 RepID=A0A0C2INE0_9PEZI|nr:homeobox transcription factor [Sporothrix brasiliensis 5110]KIH88505.1 homeobox transcription factor [Sporothrix brasiliensis 5110]